MYMVGEGIPQDYLEAAKWYRLAADQGEGVAQGMLATMYANGKGVSQDNNQALLWANIAAANGNKDMIVFRNLLIEEMIPDQISQAEHLAKNWKPKKSGRLD